MQRVWRHCSGVLDRVIFIGFGIQIALGIFWMCNAFTDLEGVGEGIVCVGQMLFFAFCVGCFFRFICRRSVGFCVFGSLSLLTFPMILQCHMEPDARSVASSLLFLELTCVLYAMKDTAGKGAFYAALACWLASGLLKREYLYLGAVLILLFLGYVLFPMKKKQAVFRSFVLAMAVGGLAFGVSSFYQESRDIRACIVSRFSWSVMYDTYGKLSRNWRDKLDYEQTIYSAYEATGIETILMPALSEQMEREEIGRFLRDLIRISWKNHSKQILKEIAWDLAGYTVPPVVLEKQLVGRAYSSFSGKNYRQILLPAPRLGKTYMDYGCWWFQVALAIGIVLRIIKRRMPARRDMLVIGILCGSMILFYVMEGAGKMDYKNVPPILCMWLAMVLTAAFPSYGRREWRAG